MHITLILSDINFRGGERLFANLATGFLQEGERVSVVAGRVGKNPQQFPKRVSMYSPPKPLNLCFQHTFLFVLLSMPITILLLLRNSRSTDVLYTTESFLSLWPAVIVSRLLKKKLVLAVFELGNTSEIHPAMPAKKLFTALNTFFVKQVSQAISINQSLVPVLQTRYQIPRVTWIPAGIDTTKFRSHQKTKSSTRPIILMPGVLHPIKNHALAIEIISQLKQQFPDILLLLTGDGTTAYREELAMLIHKRKVQKHVRFTGVISEKTLRDYYTQASMVLHCGPIAGITIIEALLMNTMPIYPTSGNPPQGPVEAFRIGLMVKTKTPPAYNKLMTEYLRNPATYRNKLQKDHRFVMKTFALPSVVKKTLAFINS